MNIWIDRIHAVVSVAAAAVFSVIVVGMSADVISRAVSGQSIPGVLEISEVILVIAVFASFGVTQWHGQHIYISLLTSRLPHRWRIFSSRLSLIISALFVVWLIWITGALAAESFAEEEVRHGILGVPIWPARIMIVVGLVWWLVEITRQVMSMQPEPTEGESAVSDVL